MAIVLPISELFVYAVDRISSATARGSINTWLNFPLIWIYFCLTTIWCRGWCRQEFSLTANHANSQSMCKQLLSHLCTCLNALNNQQPLPAGTDDNHKILITIQAIFGCSLVNITSTCLETVASTSRYISHVFLKIVLFKLFPHTHPTLHIDNQITFVKASPGFLCAYRVSLLKLFSQLVKSVLVEH